MTLQEWDTIHLNEEELSLRLDSFTSRIYYSHRTFLMWERLAAGEAASCVFRLSGTGSLVATWNLMQSLKGRPKGRALRAQSETFEFIWKKKSVTEAARAPK